jgi:23S rRNA pseudouridine1911/1915/1917 synthase
MPSMTAPFPILYEDDHLLFVDKPAGVVVQPSRDPAEPFLFQTVTDYLRGNGEEAFLLQRLDRDTTGVMFFSKSSAMNSLLTRQFEQREIRKTYAAIAVGRVGEAQLIDAPIGRVGPILFGVRASGKPARTELDPVAWRDESTLLRIRLMTGRTHQIRVHLASIGHPVLGDWLYGERDDCRPRLHAHLLQMTHPATGAPLAVAAPLPADFLALYPDGERLLAGAPSPAG